GRGQEAGADHRRRGDDRGGAAGAPRRPLRAGLHDTDAAGVLEPRGRHCRRGRGDPASVRGGGRGRPPRGVAGRRDAVGADPAQQPRRHLPRLRGRPAGRGRAGRVRLVQPRDRDVRGGGRAGALPPRRPARLRPHRRGPARLPLRRLQGVRGGDGALLHGAPRVEGLLPPDRLGARRRRPDRPRGPRRQPVAARPDSRSAAPADARDLAQPARHGGAGPRLRRQPRRPLGGRLRRLRQPPPVLGHRPRARTAGIRAPGPGARI
ncbi:MAG: UDP-glucose 4-epimerase, partial [uncultured Thermomicrobiales bacterium]